MWKGVRASRGRSSRTAGPAQRGSCCRRQPPLHPTPPHRTHAHPSLGASDTLLALGRSMPLPPPCGSRPPLGRAAPPAPCAGWCSSIQEGMRVLRGAPCAARLCRSCRSQVDTCCRKCGWVGVGEWGVR